MIIRGDVEVDVLVILDVKLIRLPHKRQSFISFFHIVLLL